MVISFNLNNYLHNFSYQETSLKLKLNNSHQIDYILKHEIHVHSDMLFDNYFIYRLVTGHRIEYEEITEIGAKKYLLYGPTVIVKARKKSFYPRDVRLSCGREENAVELLQFFKNKGLKLSENAKKLIQKND